MLLYSKSTDDRPVTTFSGFLCCHPYLFILNLLVAFVSKPTLTRHMVQLAVIATDCQRMNIASVTNMTFNLHLIIRADLPVGGAYHDSDSTNQWLVTILSRHQFVIDAVLINPTTLSCFLILARVLVIYSFVLILNCSVPFKWNLIDKHNFNDLKDTIYSIISINIKYGIAFWNNANSNVV